MKSLPVEYHYEFYSSRHGDPFGSYKTKNPLGAISKGDFLDWRGFPDFPLKVASGSRVQIAEIEHILWEIQNDHIGHKSMILIEVVKDSD